MTAILFSESEAIPYARKSKEKQYIRRDGHRDVSGRCNRLGHRHGNAQHRSVDAHRNVRRNVSRSCLGKQKRRRFGQSGITHCILYGKSAPGGSTPGTSGCLFLDYSPYLALKYQLTTDGNFKGQSGTRLSLAPVSIAIQFHRT